MPGDVLVLEREAVPGGIPRHSDHPGYGIRDLKTFISGPAYARRLTDGAVAAGATIRTSATVTGWAGERTAEVTSPEGRSRVTARAIILGTGARERPRAARRVPGNRPAGVYTTGELQQLVHLHHRSPGTRALIVGAELVSWSAALTLRNSGCRPILMTSLQPSPESFKAFSALGRLAFRLPVRTCTRVARIIGQTRVEAVELENIITRARETVACDTVIFTGDWIPDHELARAAGLELDAGTLGPLVDTSQATSIPGIYAIGNLTHPVDSADIAALDGRAVAEPVLTYLSTGCASAVAGPRLLAGLNLKWISPGMLNRAVAPPRGRLLAWPERQIAFPTVTVNQATKELSRHVLPWVASPGRVLRIPATFVPTSHLTDEPIIVAIHSTGNWPQRARFP